MTINLLDASHMLTYRAYTYKASAMQLTENMPPTFRGQEPCKKHPCCDTLQVSAAQHMYTRIHARLP